MMKKLSGTTWRADYEIQKEGNESRILRKGVSSIDA